MVKTVIQYEAFVKITETGSFTKAAESMGYTQSAVSQMIKTLEEELDTVLIHRSKKGIELSPDGKEFLPYIKNVYNSHRELIEKIIGCKLNVGKDKNQSKECGCVESVEIGTYNTCKNGCA